MMAPRVVTARPVERIRVGDRFFWSGLLVEVHRITERPTAGIRLVVELPIGDASELRFRGLFYKYGETVEVLQ